MKKQQPPDAAELRRSAEERLKRQRPAGGGQKTDVETARLVHELQVHQIELEMQNEALLESRAHAETLLAQYTDLYDFAPAGYVNLDREGAIRQVNLSGARLLGVERSRLVNRRFGLFVAEGDRRAFSDFLQRVLVGQAKECCEVTLPQEGSPPLVVRIEGARSPDGQECRAIMLDITARKRAEKVLQSATAFLDNVINAIADPVFVKDDTRRFVLVNDALCAIVGRPREGLLGEDGDDMFPKEQVEVFRQMDAGVLDTGEENVNEELLSNLSSGEVRTIVTRKTRYIDPAGKRFLVGVIRDITERKRAEQALHESEERTTKAFHSIPDALVISRLDDGTIVEVNDGWHKVFGYSPEEVIGKSALALKLFADSTDRERAMALLREQGSVRDCELQIRQKSGLLRTVCLSIEILNIQGDQYLLTVVQDITERKRADEALRESAERHRTILETATDGFWLADTQGRLLEVNETYCRMSGYREQELLAMHIPDLEAVEAADDTAAHLQRIVAQGNDRFESRHRRKDGSICDVEVSVQYQPDEGGRFIAFLQDITERKRADEKMKGQVEELQRWQDVMLGREDRVQELKREVNELCRRTGETVRYPSQEAGPADAEAAKPNS